MTTPLSKRVQSIKPSPTLAVTAKAAELRAAGKDVIGLGAGEPDFDTPDHIKKAGIDAINNGQTRYTPVGGTPDLKQAIITKLKRDNDLNYTPEQIVASTGAKQSIYNLMQALLNPGDEVIIPAPYWVSYPDMSILAEAKPIIVETGIDEQFKLTPEKLAASITSKSKLLILNSPSNPTGVAYSNTELKALGEVIEKHPQLHVMSDDIYEHILWQPEPFSNILMACPSLYDRTIIINGASKAYAMTGWRLGYAAGPVDLIKAMTKIQGQSTSNPCSISQIASIAAFTGDHDCVKEMVKSFKERHDFVYQSLNAMEGIKCLAGDGAFYAFPNITGLLEKLPNIADDTKLAEHLIEHAGIAVVPGMAFGAPGYMRLSFATSMKNLEAAMKRLAEFVSSTN